MLKIYAAMLAGMSAIALPSSALADSQVMSVPSSWRLQQYGPNSAVVYYTGSSCISGMISVPTSYNADDINRFWSTIMTAKIIGKTVGIYYDGSTSQCYLTSYYLKEE